MLAARWRQQRRNESLVQRKTRRGDAAASNTIRSLQDTAYREHSKFVYMMHELSRLISIYFDKAMTEHRLTHAQWWALMHIFEREGVTQSELAEIMQMGRASTGKLLERLEAKTWIERRADAGDGRVRRIYLRDEVVPVFALMTVEGKRLFKTFLKGISAAEEASLIAGLQKIKANAEHQSDRPSGQTDS
jgi:MarR family transcriptional regulator for hemolysin